VALLAAGCATPAPARDPREQRTTRPQELHTAGAWVLVLDVQDTRFNSPEAYLRFVEDEAKRGLTGRRFRRIESRYAIEPEGPAPLCVRYETVVEDSQVPGFPGAVFVLAAFGACTRTGPDTSWT
jgi:hypothetical protein